MSPGMSEYLKISVRNFGTVHHIFPRASRIAITFSSLLCATLRSEVGALKVELDAGVVWDHWIGWGMAQTGVSGSMIYYRIIKEYKYYLLHCWRCLDMNETVRGRCWREGRTTSEDPGGKPPKEGSDNGETDKEGWIGVYEQQEHVCLV